MDLVRRAKTAHARCRIGHTRLAGRTGVSAPILPTLAAPPPAGKH